MKLNLTWLVAVILMAGCSKDDDGIANPSTAYLSVKLNQTYLTNTQIDSAFAVWKTNNQQQRIELVLRNDSLIADINSFNEGNGELTLQIFSNKKYYNSFKAEFISKKEWTIQKNKPAAFDAPASFFDNAWLPRVLIKDGIGHEAVVGLKPGDAYFIIKKPPHDYYRLAVDRGYWKTKAGIQLAGRGVWECMENCTGIANEDFFEFLPFRIGTKPWDHISVMVLFQTTDSGEGWVLNFEHDI